MPPTQTLLSVTRLKKYFPMPKKRIFQRERPYLRAVREVSLEIKRGETFGLVGESGCGKSTLGRTILQLHKSTAGEVRYFGRNEAELLPKYADKNALQEGVELTKLTRKEFRALRKDLQIIFQDPYSSLNPRMTVGQIIAEGAITHGYFRKNGKELQSYVVEIMEKCGLQPYMLHRYPHQFSGGQRQRVCIARALAVKPKFIVCDECVSALDVSVQSQILNLLADLKEREGLTYLFISHDLSVVRHVSDRIAVMYLGEIVELGNAEDIFEDPRHPYTVALISAVPSAEQKEEKILLSGSMPSAISIPSGCPFHTRCFMAQECCRQTPPPLKETAGRLVACHFSNLSAAEKREIARSKSSKSKEENT